MKTKINRFLLAFITFIMMGAFQADPSAQLIGSWTLKSLIPAYPENMKPKTKADAEKDIQDLTGRLKKTKFIFSKDGHLSFERHSGMWKMSSDGKTVGLINDNKEKIVATILSLSAHQLVFSRVDDGIKQTFTLTR